MTPIVESGVAPVLLVAVGIVLILFTLGVAFAVVCDAQRWRAHRRDQKVQRLVDAALAERLADDAGEHLTAGIPAYHDLFRRPTVCNVVPLTSRRRGGGDAA